MRLCVIPARGGSKRIPRKNIRPFLGRPILAYSIDAARACGLFEHIVVSTDDDEIAAVAEACGAEVPFLRPHDLADDYTGTNDVARHAIAWFTDQGMAIEHVCCLYATAPLVQADRLSQGYRQLCESGAAFAFSVTHYDFPVQRAIRIRADGGVEPFDAVAIHQRSQDLDEAYHDAGQFYWGTAEAFLTCQPLYAPTSVPVLLPRQQVQDIDTLEDWRRAEMLFEILHRAGELS